MKILFLFLSLFVLSNAAQKPLEKVSLQLLWLHQFQFAGYYMAKEKGFYKDAGFDVEIKEYRVSLNVENEVVSDKATFGVGRSNLIINQSHPEKLCLISAIFQSSPLVLIALENSNINSVKDFKNKKIMLTGDAVQTASLHAMIYSHNIDINEINIKEHTFNLKDLIEGKVDLYASYISNEPYLLEEMGIKYKIFSPKDDGFDFYSDILFTSKKISTKNPNMVDRFREASLKGWIYAFEHIDESVELVYNKYNTQNKTKNALRYEATALKKLAYRSGEKFGNIDKNKIQRIHDVYKIMGVTDSNLNFDKLIYHSNKTLFTPEEAQYLQNKKEIKICVLPDSLPYSAIQKGEYVGIGAEILNLTKEYTGVEYKLVETKSWTESLQKGVNRECDILPVASKAPSREKFFNFTSPYHYEPLIIVTDKNKNYMMDLNNVIDKTFSIVKGQSFIEEIKHKYPKIKLKLVNSTKDGLIGVENGIYYGHIDVLMSVAYEIKHRQNNLLKISSQFDDKIDVGFAVRKDDKVLFNIFEKISTNFKDIEIQKLLNNWVDVKYTHKTEFEYLKELLLAFIIIVGGFFYRQNLLNDKNKELEKLQDELVILNRTLESKVVKANDDLQRAQDIAKIGSWVYDIQKKDLRWSLQAYKIFALNPQSEHKNLYTEFMKRIHPQDINSLKEVYFKSLKDKNSYRYVHRLLMDDGSVKYVEEHCETSFDDAKPLVSYGTVQDITESILAKEEMRKKDLYLQHQARLAQMGEMMSMIAHQWKQPLSSISTTQIAVKMALELENYDFDDKKQRDEFLQFLNSKLDKLGNYVQNLSSIISDFSDFYKPNKKSQVMQLNESTKKACNIIEDSIQADNITLNLKLSSKDDVLLHENEFMQVVLCIVNNAREQLIANDIKNPVIDVKSYDENDSVVLEIVDNGGGIDNDIINKIFNPYFSTKLEKNGTGLGLYMSKSIIKEHHRGDISVRNVDGGAKFIIKIKKALDVESQN